MKTYRRILSVADLSTHGLATARQAGALALKHGAQLGLGHVVDWDHGSNEFSVLTPQEIEMRLEIVVKRKLFEMASLIGAAKAHACVSFLPGRQGLAEILQGWQPDLLVLDARNSFGLVDSACTVSLGWPCDVMSLDIPVPSFHLSGLFQVLAQPLLNHKSL
ncbi:MAG: universal stress protein [Rhodospirillales bacterium]|nr:universal stress protein [Rhodospirillales bacterium]